MMQHKSTVCLSDEFYYAVWQLESTTKQGWAICFIFHIISTHFEVEISPNAYFQYL